MPQTAPKAIRRGPTHMTAKVGKILVALVEHRHRRHGLVLETSSYAPTVLRALDGTCHLGIFH